MVDTIQTRMTAAEYALLPETTQPMELIDGEMIELPAPKVLHQRLVVKLIKFLTSLLPGGEVCVSPSDVHFDELNVVQPDVFWISGAGSRCRLGEDGDWHGAPDLIIEVLSPSTALHDRREKFQLYEKHGVQEYWIADPVSQYIEVWHNASGTFNKQGIYGADESFKSVVLNDQKIELKTIFSA
jgi:Uma2 family endonuclease